MEELQILDKEAYKSWLDGERSQANKKNFNICRGKVIQLLKDDVHLSIQQAEALAESLLLQANVPVEQVINARCDNSEQVNKNLNDIRKQENEAKLYKYILIVAPTNFKKIENGFVVQEVSREEEKQIRRQQYQNFRSEHPDLAGLEDADEEYDAENPQALQEYLYGLIETSSRNLSIVFNGHGTEDGRMVFEDKNGQRTFLLNTDYLNFLSKCKLSVNNELSIDLRVIFAQCHGHVYEKADDIIVEHFTTPTKPFTINIFHCSSNSWIHFELQEMAKAEASKKKNVEEEMDVSVTITVDSSQQII